MESVPAVVPLECRPATTTALTYALQRALMLRASPVFCQRFKAHAAPCDLSSKDFMPLIIELGLDAQVKSSADVDRLVPQFLLDGQSPFIEVALGPKPTRYKFTRHENALPSLDSVTRETKTICPDAYKNPVISQAPLAGKHPLSFREYLLNGEQLGLPDDCAQSLRNAFNKGESLNSPKLASMAVPLWKWNQQTPASEHRDLYFYHYTKSEDVFAQMLKADEEDRAQAHLGLVNARKYEDIFSFTKKASHSTDHDYTNWLSRRVFYVAEDPKSTQDYGHYRVTLEFDPRTPVITISSATNNLLATLVDPEYFLRESAKTIATEFRSSHPGFENCPSEALLGILAEESGIGLIAYYGLDTILTYGVSEPGTTWFHVLNSRYITGSWANRK